MCRLELFQQAEPLAEIGRKDPIIESHDEGELPVENDEQLLQIANIIHGTETSNNIEALMDPLFDVDFVQFMGRSPLKYIKKLSQLNVVRHSQRVATNFVSGGSRDEPSRFKLPCPNAVHGCEKLWDTDEQARVHLAFCKSVSAEAHAAAQDNLQAVAAKKTWFCDKCSKSYSTKGALKSHQITHTIGFQRSAKQKTASLRRSSSHHRAMQHTSLMSTLGIHVLAPLVAVRIRTRYSRAVDPSSITSADTD